MLSGGLCKSCDLRKMGANGRANDRGSLRIFAINACERGGDFANERVRVSVVRNFRGIIRTFEIVGFMSRETWRARGGL